MLQRSADSFVREFRDLGSRGHGCPRSGRRFDERRPDLPAEALAQAGGTSR
jgi:hypothetical protein